MVGFSYSSPHSNGDPKAIEKVKNQKTIIYPNGFTITWGNDNRYWRLPPQSPTLKNMSSGVAELLQVSWLEVTCWTDNVEVGQSYRVGFNLSMTPTAFGWKGCEVHIMAKIGKTGKFVFKKVCLDTKCSDGQNKFNMPEDDLIITVKPPVSSPGDSRLYLGMYEVWSGKWKGGLKIHHAFVKMVGN